MMRGVRCHGEREGLALVFWGLFIKTISQEISGLISMFLKSLLCFFF